MAGFQLTLHGRIWVIPEAVNNVPRGQPGFKERVDFGKVIGKYTDPKTGVSTPTTKGIINYSKNGIHIVPAKP